ncbi:hypothetical protein [Amycolatopsis sp. FDAARGOS 1241]|uniref:hypothetical protein n=1 Tax=Amycolatopsis sp. FDAARGOS 1241 TaxID=2778070 RepID=UPI00194E4719|nr:hypothetical protein [Amycolatopsis sp. FDAARGOS 1241]QRP49051.1 hypothetical protein I6J71_15385 [Amycolatopsis sp. FDAARGOS 1241]
MPEKKLNVQVGGRQLALSNLDKPLGLTSPALLVRGIAQVGQGTVSLAADQVTPLDPKSLAVASRDFR